MNVTINNYLQLDLEKKEGLIAGLNELLADYHIHYQKMRNFHWNVSGQHFFELHRKFEEMYNEAKLQIDEIAERILTLGHHPVSNLSEYIYISELAEISGTVSAQEMVRETQKDLKYLIFKLRQVIQEADKAQDMGTTDMLTVFLKAFEKKHWMFNSFLGTKV